MAFIMSSSSFSVLKQEWQLLTNSISPTPSNIQWFMQSPKTNLFSKLHNLNNKSKKEDIYMVEWRCKMQQNMIIFLYSPLKWNVSWFWENRPYETGPRVHIESEGKQNSENSGNKDGNGNLSNREHVPCTETKSKIETRSQVQQGAWGEWGSDSRWTGIPTFLIRAFHIKLNHY